MRKLASLFVIAGLTACGGGGGSVTGPQVGSAACENDGQKQFVLDNLYAWYLWNDLLPANISIDDYASPEELIVRVTSEFGPQDASDQPIDRFSFVRSLQSDREFLGEGTLDEFFDGLPVDCAAPDDLNTAIGAADDPNVVAALSYLNSVACPVAAASDERFKAEYTIDLEQADRRGPPHREYLDVF